MRTLVLGSMPAGATPRTHLASGPWCFVGQEERFPGWDGSPLAPHDSGRALEATPSPDAAIFPMPDDPYTDARHMEHEARAANGEVLRLIRLLGNETDKQSGQRRSERYWQMALGPFLLPAVHMLAERQRRVADLLRLHGKEHLRVELLPEDIPFSFRSTLDFMLNVIQDVTFNQYVFSRIVEAALATAPAEEIAWEAVYLPPASLHQAEEQPRMGLPARIKGALRQVLRDLPFPRYKGFSLGQAVVLSLAVLSNSKRLADKSLDFSQYAVDGFVWRFPAETLIRACLPLELRRGIASGVSARTSAATWSECAGAPLHGPLRGMTPAFSQDDAYRLRLAALRESGCRLFSVQHGANYGNLLSVGILPFEYSQHAFFTWGWERHEGQPANARPLTHPALAAICGTHKETAPQLILVGTEMSAYTYRLKSRPLAKAMLAYRMGKIAFFRSLLAAARPCTEGEATPKAPSGPNRKQPALEALYRPYFKVAGGLDDADYVRRHLPEIGLCAGDLSERMLACRLLVLDHYGTTLHMALAADVPTVAFWNRQEWGMESESDAALDKLQEAGILHASPEAAARQAAAVWENPSTWWKSPPVRQARAFWLERYARVGDNQERPWSKGELTRRWFAALRKA